MKYLWFTYTLSVILIALGVSWFVLITRQEHKIIPKLSFLPVPSALSLTANAQVTTLDLWSPPQQIIQNNTIPVPQLTAVSAVSYDLSSNRLLYMKNAQEKRPMASLTKIMTAVVSLEHPKPDDKYLVTNDALVGEDSVGIAAGEIFSQNDLLYGLVLHSGNDAAMTLALNFPGGVTAFMKAMNEKAASLGLVNTHFTNPTGLEGDGDQHTTAYDLLVITRFALQQFPQFRRVVSTFDYIIPQTATHQEYDLENETNLLTSYPGVQGVKDGFTPEAGLCLVTYLNYQNHKIIAIVLGSDNRRNDMKQLLDYSLKKEGVPPPPHV